MRVKMGMHTHSLSLIK